MDKAEPTVSEQLKAALDKYLGERQDAYQWLFLYRHFCHALDDVIDIPERRADNEFILMTFNKALDLYSHPFYQSHVGRLYSVVKIIHNTYADSVIWEQSKIEWQKTYADVIRCCMNYMLVTVVSIAVTEQTGSYDLGYEAGREVSLLAREKSWNDHHSSNGTPI